MKKLIAFLLSVCMLFCVTVSAKESVTVSSECDISDIDVPLDSTPVNAAIGQTLDIKAKSVVLMEPNTGKVLYEANSDEKLPPASITKIMSLLLVMEAIDRGDISLETVVTASEHACSMGGSQIWLEPGETMTVNDLLKAAVIASANDACVALGETVAGSEEGFVALMNERAKELGMTNTHFVNCTGLDAEEHLTTAYDVALMSSALIKHDLIKDYSTVWMDTLRDGKSELVNTNKLVRFYEGTTGLKTGTTSTAKYCLSATAERNGLELVAVVMAGESSNDRFGGAKKLLDYGFANYNYSSIDAGLDEKTELEVLKGTQKTVEVLPQGNLNVLLPKSASGKIERDTALSDEVTAPVKKGDVLGTVTVTLNGERLGEIPLVAKEDVERLTLGVTLGWILKGLFQL
ncbi:MAG: D-alanyl-D-alanine carboxypeptidase family protein [Acutalibacteraceae bacterium]|nr:D-alanyl-D-alanine carboxypeptidase family protein [Acutalibacteraceae bacterium]